MEAPKNNIGFALCMGVSTAFGMMLAAGGCAENHDGTSAGDHAQAAALHIRVDTALAANPGYKFAGVKVAVFKSMVQLSGLVDLPAEAAQAEDIAGRVEGVKEVVDRIAIKGGSGHDATEAANDRSLTLHVSSNLNNSPDSKFDEVTVITSKGMVELSGFVSTPDQKFKAGDIARLVAGVRGLANNITVTDTM